MIKHRLRKMTSIILVVSLVLIQLLGSTPNAYAYTEDEQLKIDAWLNTDSKTEDPKNLLSYQDSVNAVFESFSKINNNSEGASNENLAQCIKTLIDALKSDSILDIIDITGITDETYGDIADEQKIKYDLSLLNYDNYDKYIQSIVDIFKNNMSEDIAFTRYANDTSATADYCNAVIDLLHGIREGCTRVDEATWENEWANPSAYNYGSQVDAIVAAYKNGSDMTAAIDGLVAALKTDTTLLALKDTDFTDVNNFTDEDWNTYYNKGLSCERQLTDYLYSINATKLQDGSFKEYAEAFQKRIKANLIEQESAFGNYVNNDKNSIGWAIQDLLSELYRTVKDVDEENWECEWVSPNAYDYKLQVDAVLEAYKNNSSGMAKAVEDLVNALKKDTILLALKDTDFTDINTLTDEERNNYFDRRLPCKRTLTDFLYSINAENIEKNSYQYYMDAYQKRLTENLESQNNLSEEQRSALYRYIDGDEDSIAWAINDLIQELYYTVKDVDEATWESKWISPSAHDYESQVDAVVTAYKNNGSGMEEAIGDLVDALKNDSTLLNLKTKDFTDLNQLSGEDWDSHFNQDLSCERLVTDYLFSINAKNMENDSYQYYINAYQKRLKAHLDNDINQREEERSALYQYINGDKDSIAWAIHDLVCELYHTVRQVDEATWESEWTTPSAYDHQETMNTIRRVYNSNVTELTQAVDQLIAELKADQTIQDIKNNGYTDFSKLQSDASWQEYWDQNLPCERVIADYLYNMKPNKMQGNSYSAYISVLQNKLINIVIEEKNLESDQHSGLYLYLNGDEYALGWAISDIVRELYYSVLEIDNPEPTPSEPTTGSGSTSTPESTVPTTPTEEVKTDQVVGEDELTITTTTKTTIDENGNIKVEENKVVTDKEGTVKETIVTSKVEDKATGTTIETVLKKDSDGSVTDANTTLQTAIESKVTDGKANIDIITPEKALIDVAKDTVLEKPLEVTIKLPEKKIIEQIASSDVKEAEIKIPISSEVTNTDKLSITNINLSKDILASAKENRTDIKIAVTDEQGKERYSMSFDSEKLEKSKKKITDINLNLDIKAGSQSANINKVLKNDSNNKVNDAVVLDFSHSGVLPITMTVNVYVGEQKNLKPGTIVFMYYMNPTTNKLDYLPNNEYTVGDDLFVKVNVNHCSEYVLLPNEVSKEVQADLLDQISIVEKKTLYVGGTKGSYFTLKPVMPSTIEQVSKFETINDEAISEVKVSYATDNKKVIRVNKSGKVVAIGTGKATISTTFQLANGEKKVVKTVVTVKKPSIKITSKTTSYKVGKEYKLTAKTYGLKGKVTWSVSNKSVANIDKATGKIKIKKAGTVIVTATCDKVKKTYKIVVK